MFAIRFLNIDNSFCPPPVLFSISFSLLNTMSLRPYLPVINIGTIILAGLKDCMQRGYSYLDGVEELLGSLKQNGYEMHAATNYPIWYGPLSLVSFIISKFNLFLIV